MKVYMLYLYSTMSKEQKEQYYIDPKVFKESLRKYYETDNLTEDLAENIKKIAYGLSFKSSFINYSYKDDMIGDALVKMWSALKYKKYNFDTGSNPFSYFTTIAFHAFINRIKKEKKYHTAVSNYKEMVYEDYMTDPDNTHGHVYIRPSDEDDS